MRLLVALVALAACTPRATHIGPEHPANPAAEPGRLAGPPTALRPGVADAPASVPPASVPPAPPPAHDHR